MSTTSLVAEFIVVGIVPFLALVFGTLAIFNVHDLTALAASNNYSAFSVLLLTLVIYFLGALFHRTSQYLGELLGWLQRKVGPLFKRPSVAQPDKYSQTERYERQAYLYQHAAAPLVQRVEYEKSLERVFGSTTFSLPLLGIALGLWVGEVAGLLPALFAVALCLVLAVLAGLSYKRQRENRYALTDAFLTLEGYPPRDDQVIYV